MNTTSRREFLGGVGKSVGYAAVGMAITQWLGCAQAPVRTTRERLRFGKLDPLVDLMQETPADALMPLVVMKLRSGTPLADIVGAGALANARAYGGTNFNGYHTLMAMMPSYEMAAQMPAPYAALPVLKVLHRNARYLQKTGNATKDALEPLDEAAGNANLVESIRSSDLTRAERNLAALTGLSKVQTYEEIQTAVRDDVDVHRVVLAWRAYDLLKLTGQSQALTMLRQPVRFCTAGYGQHASREQGPTEIRVLVPKLMEEHHLMGRERGTRSADDAWIEQLSATIYSADRATAAHAAAAALAAGFDPEDVGCAMSLAATRLLLNDAGTTEEFPDRPVGSVHGASVGVHASDAANAWRHIARVGGAQNTFATLIAGAYHTAGQSDHVGAFAHDHEGEPCTESDPAELLGEVDARIRARDQEGACIAARRYCELEHSPADLFALLLEFAVSEDGALHAEKYFRTAQDEHSTARAAHRGSYLVALTRVTASQFGFRAPGYDEARKLLAT